MGKFKTFLMYVAVIAVILSFFGFKAIKVHENMEKVIYSAMEHAKEIYPEKNLALASYNIIGRTNPYGRRGIIYNVTLADKNDVSCLIYCEVDTNFEENGVYDVKIWGGRNIDITDYR